MIDDRRFMLNESSVVQIIKTVDVSIDIIEGDVMGVMVPGTVSPSANISGNIMGITVADHLPLLFDRDTQMPMISANFIPFTSSTVEG